MRSALDDFTAHGYFQVYSHKVYHAQGFLTIEAASGKLVIDASKTLAGEGSVSGRAVRARRTPDSTPCSRALALTALQQHCFHCVSLFDRC